MRKERKKFNVKKLFAGIWYAAVILLAILVALILTAKAKGKVPKIAGYSVLQVVTGSMDPQIPVGQYILIHETPPEEIKKGDVITFYSQEAYISGLPNTHRVVEDPIKTEDGYQYVTKGDNNWVADAYPVPSDRLIGRYVENIDWLTGLSHAISSKGMLIIFVVIQVLWITMMVISVAKAKSGENENKKHYKGKRVE